MVHRPGVQQPEYPCHGLLELTPIHDLVYHAVLEQKLRTLEALGQILTDGLLNHSRPGKANQAPGSARITSAMAAKLAVTPPVVGSVRMET